jgi:nicotinate-nucleotide pyrophosphorylase (carboxylating)
LPDSQGGTRVAKQFHQTTWDEAVADDCRQLVRLAVREDLDRWHDWTTLALVPHGLVASATVVVRQAGVLAGMPAAAVVLDEMDTAVGWEPLLGDGALVEAGDVVARLTGPARSLLTAERLVLNFLGRLSGIASLTRRYVAAIGARGARIYDTRKTTPGWRRLEKYAVRCGGGWNHRTGLYDALLIKDNHLAVDGAHGGDGLAPSAAVARARQFVADLASRPQQLDPSSAIVEIEVDTLAQLEDALAAAPDIVLLDNMPPDRLRQAVALRDRRGPQVELEASGGISLATVAEVAATGVDRISVGGLTHAAVWLDLGLDMSWQPA